MKFYGEKGKACGEVTVLGKEVREGLSQKVAFGRRADLMVTCNSRVNGFMANLECCNLSGLSD